MSDYRGWIPSVAGKLSFRVIGDAKHPSPCIFANSLIGSHRYILAYQARDLSDAIHTREFGFRSLNGDFRFVLVARVKQDINAIDLPLYGHVYLLKDLAFWRKHIEPDVKTCQQFVWRYQQNLTEQALLEPRVVESIKLINRRIEANADIGARVIIRRPGEFILSHIVPKHPEFLAMQDDLRVYADVDLSDIIAAQFYYFVRDITHTHQHHHRDTDTIISVHKSTNDVDWRKNVLFSLYNHIIARKRTTDLAECVDSLGILAYARAFYIASCNRLMLRGLWQKHEQNFPTFTDEPLIASINAAIRQLENKQRAEQGHRQERWHKKIGWLAVLIAVMTLLYEFGGHEAIENARMACYVRVARTDLFGVIFLLLPVYIFLSVLKGNIDIRKWHSIRTTVRVAVAFPRTVSVGLFLFIGFGVLFGWNYAMNAGIQDGVTKESIGYLFDVIFRFAHCR